MNKPIESPLVPGGKVKHIRDISVSKIVDAYKTYKIDISSIFKAYKSISIYECINSCYRFYYPFDISGDSKFYEHFQNFDWYYMSWKWEHEVTLEYLKDNLSLLEVGCAHGAFLKKINELYDLKDSVGLELNETTPSNSLKWRIVNSFVQDYKNNNQEKFDIVCSYQVLEHISDVHSFIEAQVTCLKKGGKLIISVPNNESHIKDSDFALNLPPHHMGLWDTKSLQSLESIFPVKVVKFHYEELQEYHIGGYIQAHYYSKHNKISSKIIRLWDRMTGKLSKLENKIRSERHNIIGHTILAVFEKI